MTFESLLTWDEYLKRWWKNIEPIKVQKFNYNYNTYLIIFSLDKKCYDMILRTLQLEKGTCREIQFSISLDLSSDLIYVSVCIFIHPKNDWYPIYICIIRISRPRCVKGETHRDIFAKISKIIVASRYLKKLMDNLN